MSDAEKAMQIGNAVSEYQSAKVDAAHMDARLKTVFHAYLEAGLSMDRGRGTPTYPHFNQKGLLEIGYGHIIAGRSPTF